jgi:hypothetical protein
LNRNLKTIALIMMAICSCTSKSTNLKGAPNLQTHAVDSNKNKKAQRVDNLIIYKDISNKEQNFINKIYFKIDEVHTGNVYLKNGKIYVFNRILVVPEEENIMLISECISIGDEGGDYKLIKLSRLTDDGSALPKFGLNKVDSLKFIDSVNIQGLFNNQKKVINLERLKQYHMNN